MAIVRRADLTRSPRKSRTSLGSGVTKRRPRETPGLSPGRMTDFRMIHAGGADALHRRSLFGRDVASYDAGRPGYPERDYEVRRAGH